MGKFKGKHYSIADYEQFGVDICHAMLDFSDPEKVKQTLEMLQTEAEVEEEAEDSDDSDYSSEGQSDDEALPESELDELSGGVMSQFLELSRAGRDSRQPHRLQGSSDAVNRRRLKKKSATKSTQEGGVPLISKKNLATSKQTMQARSSDDRNSSQTKVFSSNEVLQVARGPDGAIHVEEQIDIGSTSKDREDEEEEGDEEEGDEEEEADDHEKQEAFLRVSSAPGTLSRQTSDSMEAEIFKQDSTVLVRACVQSCVRACVRDSAGVLVR